MLQRIFFGLVLVSSSLSFAMQFDKGKVTLEKLEDYSLCQDQHDSEACQEALKTWVASHPQDTFQAGKMTRKKMNAWAAIPFFVSAFESKQANCQDEDVKLAALSGLNLPNTNRKDIVAGSKKIALDLCFKEMKEAILQETSTTSYLFANTCHALVAKGELKGLKLQKCNATKEN